MAEVLSAMEEGLLSFELPGLFFLLRLVRQDPLSTWVPRASQMAAGSAGNPRRRPALSVAGREGGGRQTRQVGTTCR